METRVWSSQIQRPPAEIQRHLLLLDVFLTNPDGGRGTRMLWVHPTGDGTVVNVRSENRDKRLED